MGPGLPDLPLRPRSPFSDRVIFWTIGSSKLSGGHPQFVELLGSAKEIGPGGPISPFWPGWPSKPLIPSAVEIYLFRRIFMIKNN